MKTAVPAITPPPALAPVEKTVIGLLVLAAIGGAIVAVGDVRDRRIMAAFANDQRAREIAQAKADGARLVRESELTVAGLRSLAAVMPAAASEANKAGPAASAEDMAARPVALTQLVDLLQKGVLSSTTFSSIANQPVRPGQQIPAYGIDANGKLAPGFGELFGMNEAEVAGFQSIVTDLKQRATDLVMNHTTGRATEDGYVLEYNPPAEAASFTESALASMRSYLGEERYRIFTVLNGGHVGDNGTLTGGPVAMFETVGAATRTITFARTPTGLTYTMTTGGTVNGRGAMSGGDPSAMLTRLGPATRLIPKDFLDSIPKGPTGGARGGAGGGGGGDANTGEAGKVLSTPAIGTATETNRKF